MVQRLTDSVLVLATEDKTATLQDVFDGVLHTKRIDIQMSVSFVDRVILNGIIVKDRGNPDSIGKAVF